MVIREYRRFEFIISPLTYDRLHRLAMAKCVTMGEVVREALAIHLAREEDKRRTI